LVEVHYTQVVVRQDVRAALPAGGGEGEGALAGRNGAVILAHQLEVLRHIDGNLSQPARIVQGFRQRFGGAEVVQDVLKLPEDKVRIAQVEPQIDGLFTPRALLR
jgi:hypothetical protein